MFILNDLLLFLYGVVLKLEDPIRYLITYVIVIVL